MHLDETFVFEFHFHQILRLLFSIFIYPFKRIYIFLIYDVLPFSVKSAFCNEFIALFLLIKLIIQR